MHGREIVFGFLLSFLISLLLFFLSTQFYLPGIGVADSIFPSIALFAFRSIHPITKQQAISQTNDLNNIQKTLDYAHLKADNQALRDQFATAETSDLSLLPAHIIGAPEFLPGVGQPEQLILDQGEKSNIKKNQAVIFKNAIIGLVVQVHTHTSLVKLVSSNGISFPAKTVETNALGILKGIGNGEMILDNVVLSDELKVGDLVVSSLDVNADGTGYPPGMYIGKITAIQKNPSSLFQRASVKSLVDVTKVPLLFVILGQK